MQYSPSGRTGLTTGCNWLEFEDETEPSDDKDVEDVDEDIEEDEDDEISSLEMELSLTADKDVLLTKATILPPRAWDLRSKSSPSSSSTTYSKMTT